MSPRLLAVDSSYINQLRAGNDLAHATLGEPPKASLVGTSHVAALLSAIGKSKPISIDLWKKLVASSREDKEWVNYYACLAAPNKPTLDSFIEKDKIDFAVFSPAATGEKDIVSANEALMELTSRLVRKCLGVPAASSPINVKEKDAVIIAARLKKYGFLNAAVKVDSGPLEKIISERGCDDWNQAASWGLYSLYGTDISEPLRKCRLETKISLGDPVALYTSYELGMPTQQIELILRAVDLTSWFSLEWRVTSEMSKPTGQGTVDNTALLVQLALIKGWDLPSWIKKGVEAASRQIPENYQLLFLCYKAEANCDNLPTNPTVKNILDELKEGKISDTEASYGILGISLGRKMEGGYCPEGGKELYDSYPQAFSYLAIFDKHCWETLSVTPAEVAQHIVQSLENGNFADARAYMLLSDVMFGRYAIKKEMLASVNSKWNEILDRIAKQYGPNYLAKEKPLKLILMSAEVEFWNE